MSVDNQHQFDAAFQREAKFGLMVVVTLLAILVYVAAGKLGGWSAPEPSAFQQKPTANAASIGNVMAEPPHLPPEKRSIDAKALQATNQFGVPTESLAAPQTPAVERPEQKLVMPGKLPDAALSPKMNNPQRVSMDQSRSGAFKANRLSNHSSKPSTMSPAAKAGSQKNDLRSNSSSHKRSDHPIRRASAEESFVVPECQENELDRFIAESEAKQPQTNQPSLAAEIEPGESSKRDAASESSDSKIAFAKNTTASKSSKVESGSLTIEISDDSFWLVAQRVYGDGRYFNALFMENRDLVPSFNELPLGTKLRTPPVSELHDRWPSQCPRRKYVTQGGETPFQLACEHLGQASRYVDIIKTNYRVLPKDAQHDTELPADLELLMPRK